MTPDATSAASVDALPESVWADLPRRGVGFGFREPYRADVFLHGREIDFLEITADHYFDVPADKLAELELLRNRFPLIPHGLSLSLGSAKGPRPDYVRKLAALVESLQPAWWSEHIAFTQAESGNIGHLAPMPLTRDSLAILQRNIRSVRQEIPGPLILENITYEVTYPWSDIDEASFLGELLDSTDCGLLLDVTNLYTNSVNHGFDPLLFLHRLPADRIVQLHFVGGHWCDGTLIDSHSRPTPPEVWQLLEEVVKFAPVQGLILERDEDLPPFAEILTELQQAREIWLRHRPAVETNS